MVALFVASHYKNTPNDLQLMSDAPAHQLFALLGPVDVHSTRLPDVIAVVQVPHTGLKCPPSHMRPRGDVMPTLLSPNDRPRFGASQLAAMPVFGRRDV